MPAFSGLWDGIHGDGYAAMTKSTSRPPQTRGIIRAFMQKPGLHGVVNAIGQDAPATRARVDADRPDITVRGTFDYAAWKLDPNDAARFVTDVTVANSAAHATSGQLTINESIARPADLAAGALIDTFDTTLNNGYPADSGGGASGVTSPALAEVVET